MMIRKRRGTLAAASALTAAALAVASCGSGGTAEQSGASASSSASGPITIRLQTFGGGSNFGYKNAVDKWNAEHKDIQIQYENLTDQFEQQYWPQMIQWLQAGSGAGDVVGIDEGGMGLAKARSATAPAFTRMTVRSPVRPRLCTQEGAPSGPRTRRQSLVSATTSTGMPLACQVQRMR